jgi:hypothetical protein
MSARDFVPIMDALLVLSKGFARSASAFETREKVSILTSFAYAWSAIEPLAMDAFASKRPPSF